MDIRIKKTPPAPLEQNIRWQASEFIYHEKTADWFWVVGILSIALIIVSILMKNFLFSIIIGISGFSVLMYGVKKPNKINFSISARGIQVGEKLYLFENLNFFWVDYNPPYKSHLILESKKLLMPHLLIPLAEDIAPEMIREALLPFIKEKKIEEPLSETISKFLKF